VNTKFSRLISIIVLAVLLASTVAVTPAYADKPGPADPPAPKENGKGHEKSDQPDPEVSVADSQPGKGNKPESESYPYVYINPDGSYTKSNSTWWSHTTPNGYTSRSEWTYRVYDQYDNLVSQYDGGVGYHMVHCYDAGGCHYQNTWWSFDGTNSEEYKSVYSHGELVHTQYKINGVIQ
jgi:hypothetical protein